MSTQSPHTSPKLLKQWDSEAHQYEKCVYFNTPQLIAQYIGALPLFPAFSI